MSAFDDLMSIAKRNREIAGVLKDEANAAAHHNPSKATIDANVAAAANYREADLLIWDLIGKELEEGASDWKQLSKAAADAEAEITKATNDGKSVAEKLTSATKLTSAVTKLVSAAKPKAKAAAGT